MAGERGSLELEPVPRHSPHPGDTGPRGPARTHLLYQGGGVGAHGEVGLRAVPLDVLQAVTVTVEDEARGVVEEHPHTVVTQLIPWWEVEGDLRKGE